MNTHVLSGDLTHRNHNIARGVTPQQQIGFNFPALALQWTGLGNKEGFFLVIIHHNFNTAAPSGFWPAQTVIY
jgi:hypothetical protein